MVKRIKTKIDKVDIEELKNIDVRIIAAREFLKDATKQKMEWFKKVEKHYKLPSDKRYTVNQKTRIMSELLD